MASKKHPLEVFKQHGAMASHKNREKKGRQRMTLSLFQRAKPGTEKPKPPPADPVKSKRKPSRLPPGDRKISLTMNNLLIAALVVVAVSLATYFWGYSRGKRLSPDEFAPSLREQQTQLIEEQSVTPTRGTGAPERYGVQVCTWDASKKTIAQEAQSWLLKKGFNSKLGFVNSQTYVIFVGSFSDADDPELLNLLRTLKNINDYPYGSSSPFKSAMIKRYQLSGGLK